MQRAKHPIPKSVLVVTDYPIQAEVENDQPWSGASHLSLLGDLTKAGISPRDIHLTYLSYERPDKESFDWTADIKKKKNLPVGSNYGQVPEPRVSIVDILLEEDYGIELPEPTVEELGEQEWFALPHQKDCYISKKLHYEVAGLLEEIRKVQPQVIITAGKWSYFFLAEGATLAQTQNSGSSQKPMGGLAKHRASLEQPSECLGLGEVMIFPVLPPVTKQRSPDKIPVMKWDYAKVGDIYTELKNGKELKEFLQPNREFIIGSDFNVVTGWFKEVLYRLAKDEVEVSVDIETRYSATIDCIGFATDTMSGLCVPFSTLSSPNFWELEEEIEVLWLMRQVMLHPNVRLIAQNGSYEAAFMNKYWLMPIVIAKDTMVQHHVLYNSMQKDLAFLASVYCQSYTYWKDLQVHGG